MLDVLNASPQSHQGCSEGRIEFGGLESRKRAGRAGPSGNHFAGPVTCSIESLEKKYIEPLCELRWHQLNSCKSYMRLIFRLCSKATFKHSHRDYHMLQ